MTLNRLGLFHENQNKTFS